MKLVLDIYIYLYEAFFPLEMSQNSMEEDF